MWLRANRPLLLLYCAVVAVMLAGSQGNAAPALPAGDSLRTVADAEVRQIAGKLMAPCCWSQTADVHQSEAADQIQAQIRMALQRGQTEQQIIAGFVAVYGERILATPAATGFNLMVWILPIIALPLGGWILWRYLRHVQPLAATPPAAKAAPVDDSYEARFERELAEFNR
ncbi:MAG: cytochrome c-type biogenesis protein CcmH [candidate division KSB1 bacterium]|nr:cytochrome c-type biogenesis protein CcmH [candidate division KSB1 bacterium]MDZ7273661.1 cytochrome c-type biogenesis protein CcmH [candidate division KSB1 bacterium]MDZ7285817.1 cytochrome c-type biogenesis protein CcmH [candidate division KSB1 bacterium]MDZ7298849.1 cytochrome c-type biogenesis protein CcmH [candidate division KSB1 bacterium]MDZ7308570.1 cytochrome c-type biogenesis protein CcmH [candidate division KSB1 bacterium]